MSKETNPTNPPLSLADVLEEELASLQPEWRRSEKKKGATEEERLQKIYKSIHDLPQKRSALCLSGGGIRSATFCLGVLQGLARCGLLGKFDYLSTVSGGGYIGSWLTAWMQRDGTAQVLSALKENPTSKTQPEPKQISHLRSFSNYLSPKLGFFSVDTWTLVAIYLRNLFLNWLVFIPFLLALLTIPRFYAWALRRAPGHEISIALMVVGVFFGALSLAYIASHRPSIRRLRRQPPDPANNLGNFILRCMLPLILSVLLLTIGRAWYLNVENVGYGKLGSFVLFGTSLHFFAWILYARHLRSWPVRLRELGVVLGTGFLGGAFLWLTLIPARHFGIYSADRFDRPEIFACFDGPLLMTVFLLMGILSIGIGGNSIDDEDREWWARAGAWVLLAIVGWTLLNSLVLYGPHFLSHYLGWDWNSWRSILSRTLLWVGFVSSLITILFALSSKTPATANQAEKPSRYGIALDYAVRMAAPLSALVLIAVLALFTDLLLLLIEYVQLNYDKPLKSHDPLRDLNHLEIIRSWSLPRLFSFFVAMLVIGYLMARCININEFSLHSMYRNRLTRAYLGASTIQRSPQQFTGFDRKDDLKMSDLWPNKATETSETDETPPFHILNMTWNLVAGKDLARQNRKAVSFTASPLHCGSALYGYRRSNTYGGGPDPISLGTALTVSGAAASPNMGYHSSAAITFLMTLLNARLGWWLGNPRHHKYSCRSGPRSAVAPMFEEAFGWTDDRKRYIYLSDGGHFENLGLYEMVLRRCHYIFVVDASRDPDYKFENLGNAIRSIRVDMGVPIKLGDIFMYPRKAGKPNAYCALGKILYSRVNEPSDGMLVYIKPVIDKDEPTDVFNYAQDRDFPHESTSDQWFSEQQFESYRMLGLHAIEQIFPDRWSPKKDFSDVEGHIEKLLKAFKVQ